MTDIRKVIATNIKAYRKEKGLSQAALAEKIGISTRAIAFIETCKSYPSHDMLGRIAAGLEKDTLDLLSLYPIQHEWQDMILTAIGVLVDEKLDEIKTLVTQKLKEASGTTSPEKR